MLKELDVDVKEWRSEVEGSPKHRNAESFDL